MPDCGLCHIAPAIQIFQVAAEGPDSVHVSAVFAVIVAYIGYYSMLVLAIIYGLPSFYDLKERRTNTKAICDICLAFSAFKNLYLCTNNPKFVNWLDQKVVRPDVYPAGSP